MARSTHKLSDVLLRRGMAKAGIYSDGQGLYLRVYPAGSKSWIFIYHAGGKRREMGLGSYPSVSLAAARDKATDARKRLAKGGDPISSKRAGTPPTFREVARMYIEAFSANKSAATLKRWHNLTKLHCTALDDLRIDQITTQQIVTMLTKKQALMPSTAKDLRSFSERIFAFARVRGMRDGDNPALWRNHLSMTMPPLGADVTHFEAMPYNNVPAFMTKLIAADHPLHDALAFLILTASRSNEVIGATWGEFDAFNHVWTIPAERMKSRREHRVPLTAPASHLLQRQVERWGAFPKAHVFSVKAGSRAGERSFQRVMAGMDRLDTGGCTSHGFRTSFSMWAAENGHPSDIVEMCLSHAVGNAVSRSYQRSDLIERRGAVMKAWADYVTRAWARLP